jgi:CBS domain-containing protein
VVVVDAQRSLRGLVTRTDVLRAEPGSLARDAMSPYIFALPAISRIERAAALMAFEDVAHVVVTGTDNELLGLVSAVDIARHFAILSGFLPG